MEQVIADTRYVPPMIFLELAQFLASSGSLRRGLLLRRMLLLLCRSEGRSSSNFWCVQSALYPLTPQATINGAWTGKVCPIP
jgi:hypothetical protein